VTENSDSSSKSSKSELKNKLRCRWKIVEKSQSQSKSSTRSTFDSITITKINFVTKISLIGPHSSYGNDVAHRRPTKLCTMFGRLLGCYITYTFSGALALWQNFARCKIHFTSKSCVLVYWQRYCTALQQWASAKLCDVVQGMELLNFCRGRHLYLAGRPSRWASAHILVSYILLWQTIIVMRSWYP